MKKIKLQQKPANEDKLYSDALDSLKKLNEEILLNKLNDDFKELVKSLQDEIDNFNSSMKDDFALLNGSIQRVIATSESNSNEIISTLKENTTVFTEKLHGFSQYFTQGVRAISSSQQKINNEFMERLTESIQVYKDNFQNINDKHYSLNEISGQNNQKLEDLVNNFSVAINDNKVILNKINEDWLASLDVLNSKLQSEVEKLKHQVKDSELFYERVRKELLEEIIRLTEINGSFNKAFELTTKNNEKLQHQLEQNKEFFQKAIEEIKTEVSEVKQQNQDLINQLQEQQLSTKKAQKLSLGIQIVTIIGVVTAIILSL